MFKIEHFSATIGFIVRAGLSMIAALQSARFIFSLLAAFGILLTAFAQPSVPAAVDTHAGLSAEQVVDTMVRKNIERAQALITYRSTRIYRLDYHGFPGSRSAEMVVDVTYHSPGKKEFSIQSEKGSHFLIERVFQRMLDSEKEALNEANERRVALNHENYRFSLVGYETTTTGPAYILAVEPITNNKLLYRGRIWVDARDFAVVRIEAEPAKNPSFWTKETRVEQVYAKVGDFWLPLSNRSDSDIRLGGHANFSIDYRDYQITAATPVDSSPSLAGSR